MLRNVAFSDGAAITGQAIALAAWATVGVALLLIPRRSPDTD